MIQTPEELELVKLYLELPYAADVIEVDKKKIANSDIRMKEVLIKQLNRIQDELIQETYRIKQRLKSEGIKIIEDTRTTTHLEALYQCRGYQHNIALLWGKVRADVMLILARHMKVKVEDG